MRRTLALVSIGSVLILTSLGTSIVARQASAQPDVLNALLVEVRGLRAAMEHLAAAGPRVQLTMGRLQLQEQRINTLVRRLDEIRDRRNSVETAWASQKMELSALEDAVKRDGASREYDVQIKGVKMSLADSSAQLERLQNEGNSLGQEIAAEQGRWSEINQRLEELDRALSRK
jgi:chromosome segregation ATPase